jgi:hypothetical protein
MPEFCVKQSGHGARIARRDQAAATTSGCAFAPLRCAVASGVLDASEWSLLRGLVRREWMPARRNVTT